MKTVDATVSFYREPEKGEYGRYAQSALILPKAQRSIYLQIYDGTHLVHSQVCVCRDRKRSPQRLPKDLGKGKQSWM